MTVIALVMQAHSVRFGRVSDATLTKLMDSLGQVDSYMGRYSLDAVRCG